MRKNVGNIYTDISDTSFTIRMASLWKTGATREEQANQQSIILLTKVGLKKRNKIARLLLEFNFPKIKHEMNKVPILTSQEIPYQDAFSSVFPFTPTLRTLEHHRNIQIEFPQVKDLFQCLCQEIQSSAIWGNSLEI